MSKITDLYYYNLFRAIGAELKRVREEKGLSLEEVTEQNRFKNAHVLEQIEAGQKKVVFPLIRLIDYYKKRIRIDLID